MNRLEIFNQYRPLLLAIAYRMLSSVADAEDMVQEAWLRWQTAEATVRSPKSYLSQLIARLCIDRLRSARVQRERYIGAWLPEPLITQEFSHPAKQVELAESLSFAFLTLLECLSPTERAIFLLREVFDYDYAEIAKIVGKSVPNCRQIVRRARQHLALRRPNVTASIQQQEALVEQFLESWDRGDLHGLIVLMSENITFWSDGGGKVTAALTPLHGRQKVARFLIAIRRSSLLPAFTASLLQINGRAGIVNYINGSPTGVFTFSFADRYIQSIFAVVNPEKLRAIHPSY
ncbi:RNA polymerase sigma-70 factor [Chroococcidiopsis thermalis]|uniref:RNA polymerase, sigma-24 subunit, ECF subfamily n=1 Tax=Chroococcidiopsis thermalis (strain PCC 7203) TaxID=251229 RepID=K9U845_CHRTP|nr:RNA polymerase sigma-70 factor [Chroococcidiopsis thermalis]AFY91020.1 RNA polymerase, sigma-24 subunit, ECF subfamily [Chroococcidiopsis thermalis PCC 7203]